MLCNNGNTSKSASMVSYVMLIFCFSTPNCLNLLSIVFMVVHNSLHLIYVLSASNLTRACPMWQSSASPLSPSSSSINKALWTWQYHCRCLVQMAHQPTHSFQLKCKQQLHIIDPMHGTCNYRIIFQHKQYKNWFNQRIQDNHFQQVFLAIFLFNLCETGNNIRARSLTEHILFCSIFKTTTYYKRLQ